MRVNPFIRKRVTGWGNSVVTPFLRKRGCTTPGICLILSLHCVVVASLSKNICRCRFEPETSGRDLEETRCNRNGIHSEWLAIRNGCGTTPHGPIGPSPKDPQGPPRPMRPSTQCAPYPNYSGALGPANPKSPFPQGDARSASGNFTWGHFSAAHGVPKTTFGATFRRQGIPRHL